MAKYLGIPIALAYGQTDTATGNNLVDSTASFKLNVKVGDVVFNTTDNTQAIVVGITSDSLIVLSAPIAQTSGEDYAIFAPNNDTRGNVLMSINGYIAARDITGSLSVDFTQGGSTNQQLYLPIGTPVTDSFLTKLYLRWLERLLVTNATSNRLDIPLNEFFNNSSNVPYYIKTITLS